MTPTARAADLDEQLQYRLLQANFDTALDARYAVARELVWSAYIHPLSVLDTPQLSDALLQVWTAAATFGTIFSSGALQYGGGDSIEAIKKNREELRERLQPTTWFMAYSAGVLCRAAGRPNRRQRAGPLPVDL